MRFRAEFEIKADLVFEGQSLRGKLVSKSGDVELRNGKTNERGEVLALFAAVTLNADTLSDALERARPLLADHLDWLAFTTHHRFEITKPLSVSEWKKGPGQRSIAVVAPVEPRWPPAPELKEELVASAARFIAADLPQPVLSAARAFRSGLRATTLHEQFQFFWAALEGVVESMKSRDKVPVLCQQCRTGMTCVSCGAPQMRTPMAKRAIAEFIQSGAGARAASVSAALFYLRDRLFHGGSLAETHRLLREKHRATVAECVSITCQLAFHAICLGARPHLGGDEPIVYAAPNDIVIRNAEAMVLGTFEHQGEGYPEVPEFTVKLEQSLDPFGETAPDQIEKPGG